MLVPHLHLNGHCIEALTLYEKAFATKVDHIQLISEEEPEIGVFCQMRRCISTGSASC